MDIGYWEGPRFLLEDDLDKENLAELRDAITHYQGYDLQLDFQAYDVLDGVAMAGLTRLLADWLADQDHTLALRYPPQLVVHNLYRTGRFPDPRLQVLGMRADEPYG